MLDLRERVRGSFSTLGCTVNYLKVVVQPILTISERR